MPKLGTIFPICVKGCRIFRRYTVLQITETPSQTETLVYKSNSYHRSGNFRVKKYFGCKIFVAFNFRSIAHQQKNFNDHCVENGDVRTSCCYVTYRHSILLAPVRPALLPLRFGASPLACRFEHPNLSTSRFTEANYTSQRNGERQRSFVIGESICRLEESQKDRERST